MCIHVSVCMYVCMYVFMDLGGRVGRKAVLWARAIPGWWSVSGAAQYY